jgi:hypothetical protein
MIGDSCSGFSNLSAPKNGDVSKQSLASPASSRILRAMDAPRQNANYRIFGHSANRNTFFAGFSWKPTLPRGHRSIS